MRTCLATLTTAATTPAGGGGGERGEKERGKAVNSPRFSMTHLVRGWGGVGEEGREAEKKKIDSSPPSYFSLTLNHVPEEHGVLFSPTIFRNNLL